MAEQKGANGSLKGLSIGSMVCGIVSLVSSWTGFFGFPIGVVGLVLGIVALSKGKGKTFEGRGMAIAGVVCGGIAVLFSIYIIAVGILFLSSVDSIVEILSQ